MKELFYRVLDRLLTVKSIVTIICTIVFAVLSLMGTIPADKFQDIFYIIVAFYFGSSLEKKAQSANMKTE